MVILPVRSVLILVRSLTMVIVSRLVDGIAAKRMRPKEGALLAIKTPPSAASFCMKVVVIIQTMSLEAPYA